MIFISAPDVSFDGTGRLTTLVDAEVWARGRFTPAENGTYRITCAVGASPAFTTTGANTTTGGGVDGGAPRSFIFAPTSNFNQAGDLTSLAGCVLSLSLSVTGLLGGTSYRAVVLSPPSPPIAVVSADEWVFDGSTVLQTPTLPLAANYRIVGTIVEAV